MAAVAEDVSVSARRKIGWRVLPFIFFLYIQ